MSRAPGSTWLCHVCSQTTHLQQKNQAGLGRVGAKLSFLKHFGEGKWSWRARRGAPGEGSGSRALCDSRAWPRNPIPGREAAQQQELCPVKAAFLLNEVPEPPLCPKHVRLCSRCNTGALALLVLSSRLSGVKSFPRCGSQVPSAQPGRWSPFPVLRGVGRWLEKATRMKEMLEKVLGAVAWQGAEVDGSSGRQGTAGMSLPVSPSPRPPAGTRWGCRCGSPQDGAQGSKEILWIRVLRPAKCCWLRSLHA